ncbi:hypothetical protein GCM10022251_77770 [Phytohabitans flavus]|uniref:Uncharacterized protein n=1 Tax=Phytohabitans flavus TaxID=1076124 RepID=A0A6F8XNJ8_9ACTN|nr:hypothetical protein [Phytohabitans flavus]BCB75412.1 hypothetical protein Pflav_018220 [Phytohabitans flavus]
MDGPPETVAAEAARHGLVARLVAAATRRTDPIRAGWLGAAVGAPLALLMFLLGMPVAGVLLVPAAIACGVGYALALPKGGRREAEAVDQPVTSVSVAQQIAAIRQGERLVVGPLAVTADSIERLADGVHLPWERVRSVRLVGDDRIIIGETGGQRGWFSGAVPDALGAVRLIAGLRPTASVIMPDPTSGHAERAGVRHRPHLASLAGLAALALLPGVAYAVVGPVGDKGSAGSASTRPAALSPSGTGSSPTASPSPSPRPGLPETVYEYSAACVGRGFPGAPPYQGAGPHPIYVHNGGVRGPDSWHSEDPAKIQLVVCVKSSEGRVLKKCEYHGIGREGVTQDMVLGRYRLVVREARTAKVIAEMRLDGANRYCRLGLVGGEASPDRRQVSKLSTEQLQEALGQYVEHPDA